MKTKTNDYRYEVSVHMEPTLFDGIQMFFWIVYKLDKNGNRSNAGFGYEGDPESAFKAAKTYFHKNYFMR